MIRFLRQKQLLFPLVLVVVAIAVLVLGALEQREAQSRPDTPAPEPTPVETRRPVVRADLDKAPLSYHADYWRQLAGRVGPRLTSVGPSHTPALVVGPRMVLTTIEPALELLAAQGRPDLTDEGSADEATPPALEVGGYRLRGWDADLGLALFDVSGQERVPFILTDPRAMPSGSYVGAVTLTLEGDPTVTPGYLVTTMSTGVSAPTTGDLVVSMDLPDTLTVAAVVNLDGALVGVAYTAPTGRRVVSSTTMLELIEKIQTKTLCRSVEVADLDAHVRELMVLESGVLIEYVHHEAFAPEPSLLAGDVLLEWAGTRVESAAHFEQVYDAQTPGTLVRYRVLRNRRRITGGTVVPDTDCEPMPTEPIRLQRVGLALRWVSETGWVVVAVAPDSPSAAAGIEEQDWLVSIDGIRVVDEGDRETLEERADRREPFLLSLRRDDRMKLVAVTPGEDPPEPADEPTDDPDGGSSDP